MKKILVMLTVVFYIFVSIIGVKLFSENQLYNVLNKNTYNITVSAYNSKPDKIFYDLNKIAEENKVNIYRVNFIGSTYTHKNINIYSNIGNLTEFLKNFNIVKIKNIDLNNLNITTKKERSNYIDLFDKNVTIHIKNLDKAHNIPVNGIYCVRGNNKNIFNIVNSFKNIGLNVSNVKYIETNNVTLNNILNKNLIILFIIIDLTISLSMFYYNISKYKKIAIEKLFGFSNKKIMKYCLKDMLEIYLISGLSCFIIILIYLYNYNNFSNIYSYLYYWFTGIVITTIIIFISGLPSYYSIFIINIKDMLKNKKSRVILQDLSSVSKFVFSVVIITMFVSIFSTYNNLCLEENESNWKKAKNYCYLEYDMSYMAQPGGERYYNETQTSKMLFANLNNNKAIMVYPSPGLILSGQGNDEYGYGTNLNKGNSIMVNNNYLKINPIYSINGKKINFNDYNNPNEVNILVPEMYEYEKNKLLQEYTKYINENKYININVCYRNMGKPIPKEVKVKVNIIFIKNYQKTFLYSPRAQIGSKGYSINSVIVVLNPYNYGGDLYLSALTEGSIMPYIGENNGYTKLNNELNKLNINEYIINKPLLYYRISSYVEQINSKIKLDVYLLISLIITESIVSAFMVLNYLEKDKYLNSVKYMHGYSFLKMHRNYLLLNLILWVFTALFSMMFNFNKYNIIITISILLYLLDLLISLSIMKLYSIKKINDTLKGE